MKILFIHNPCAGRRRRQPEIAAEIARFIAERHLDARLVPTERPGHATELAASAVHSGCQLVVAVGGDGTMNEVARALVHTGTSLGLVPCGSGNGLALHLGLSLRPRLALASLLSGRSRLIDTGRANSEPFFNAVGLGYEAEIAAAFAARTRRGLAGYFRVGIPLLFSHRKEICRLTHDGGVLDLKVFTLAVLNSEQYGHNVVMAPGASVDDGRLDLVAVRPVGLARAVALLWHLRRRTIDRLPELTRVSSSRFAIVRPAPAPFHLDGEPRPPVDRLEIAVQPRSLRVILP